MQQRNRSPLISAPEDEEFIARAQRYRPELLAYCYRMLGSLADAEDAVQETLLRAWRGHSSFEQRSSERTWLYRIATNVCLSMLAHHSRRVLPSGLGEPFDDPSVPPNSADPSVRWIQPVPDALVFPAASDAKDPASIVAELDSVRLALIVSMQYLPPRQRAVLILREVLAFPASEVAALLGISVAAVKSALQRARARLDELAPSSDQPARLSEPEQRTLLENYIGAFEAADVAALERLLRDDATLQAPPLRNWYAGIRTCLPYMATHVMGSPRHWRMFPTKANGQPAVAAYYRNGNEGYLPYGIVVLTASPDGISAITSFGDPELVVDFGFPALLSAEPAQTSR